MFGVGQVVGREGRFGWWAVERDQLSDVWREEDIMTCRTVNGCSEVCWGRQSYMILFACRCMMGVLRPGKNLRRQEELLTPLRLSRHDWSRLCRRAVLEEGDLSCAS